MIETVNTIRCYDFDKLVEKTYGRFYCLQQQDGCKARGLETVTVPESDYEDIYDNETVPEEVNHEDMGVCFKAWLARDAKKDPFKNSWQNEMWWHRNFYPDLQMVVNDLHSKGLLPAGKLHIVIDW